MPKVELPFEVVELENEEIRLYEKLRVSLGKGEASYIAVAKNRKRIFLSDDLDTRKTAYLLGVKSLRPNWGSSIRHQNWHSNTKRSR